MITALSVDPAGSRLVIGSTDSHLRFYDFGGMDAGGECFKAVLVDDGHPIVDVVWSNSGDRILVATTSAQPKVLDREGAEM